MRNGSGLGGMDGMQWEESDMAVGSWNESRRMASVGWWQGREAGPLAMNVVAAESMGLVFTM